MIEEILNLQKIYIKMGFNLEDARQAAQYEYKYNKNIRGKERVQANDGAPKRRKKKNANSL